MPGYIRPAVITTYSIARLCAVAATCMSYLPGEVSDRELKREIETLEQPLERLRAIRRS